MWVMKLLYIWILSRTFFAVNGFTQAMDNNTWIVSQILETYSVCWHLLFMTEGYPSTRAVDKISTRTLWFTVATTVCLLVTRTYWVGTENEGRDTDTDVVIAAESCSWTAIGWAGVVQHLLLAGMCLWGIFYRYLSKETQLFYSSDTFKALISEISGAANPNQSEFTPGTNLQAGFLSLVVVLIHALGGVICCFLILYMETDNTVCGDSGLMYLQKTYCGNSVVIYICFFSWLDHFLVFFMPPVLYLDLVIHNFQCQHVCQDMVLQSFAQNVDWRKYKRDPLSWEEHDLIAMGAEGAVYLAHLNEDPDGQLVVLKKPHITGSRALRATMQEAAILAQIHESLADSEEPGAGHIVALRGFCPVLPEVALLLEYCTGGDLLHKLQEMRHETQLCEMRREAGAAPNFNQNLRRRVVWALEVSRGMQTLHVLRIAHRDLKTDNVLLTEEGQVKISDFGCACTIVDTEASRFATADRGTLAFMAPEMMSDPRSGQTTMLEYDPLKSDLFSYGFVLFEALTFNREPHCRKQCRIDSMRDELHLTDDDFVNSPLAMGHVAVKLMESLFSPNPSARPSFDAVCDILEEMLGTDLHVSEDEGSETNSGLDFKDEDQLGEWEWDL
eukprot:TRINITY_DN1623_c0_g1_i14.p1 TRINITY_DN1623_c0_g1~~TRINITY_DN1623_c0_g1_i14.p1  ORF type:complete len:615 (-),score=103.60 TRINITY_DN1623_c0_g1_i14:348-2192(-)